MADQGLPGSRSFHLYTFLFRNDEAKSPAKPPIAADATITCGMDWPDITKATAPTTLTTKVKPRIATTMRYDQISFSCRLFIAVPFHSVYQYERKFGWFSGIA